jgi:hypothetical protein
MTKLLLCLAIVFISWAITTAVIWYFLWPHFLRAWRAWRHPHQ